MRLCLCGTRKVEGLRLCVAGSGCEDHIDGLVGRFVNTLTYLCSDDVKPGECKGVFVSTNRPSFAAANPSRDVYVRYQ